MIPRAPWKVTFVNGSPSNHFYVGSENWPGMLDIMMSVGASDHYEDVAKLIAMAPTLLEQRAQLLKALIESQWELPFGSVYDRNKALIASIESTVEKS